jgi:hypothetical protein
MKIPTWLEIVLSVGLAIAAVSWFRSHEALRDALAQKDMIQHQTSDLQAQINAAGQSEKKALADLEDARNKPATVQTVTKYLPAPLPSGSAIEAVPQDASNFKVSSGDLVLHGDPQTNLNWVQGMELSCQECKTSLEARETQYADLQKQFALSEQNAKNWQKAAGANSGFWNRAKEWGIRTGFAAGGYAAGKVMK